MELYQERGFDRTTVADIAARAGLTERTFFRYFADKREVLFWGAARLEAILVEGVLGAPGAAGPLSAVIRALEATASMFEERRELARKRQALIAAHAELKERELIKLATLASAIGEALRGRGVPGLSASLAAETGIAIFKTAFDDWLNDSKNRDLAHHVRESLRAIRVLTSGKAMRDAGARTSRAREGARSARTRQKRGFRPDR